MKQNVIAQRTGCEVIRADELIWRRAMVELCLSLHATVSMLADCVERPGTPFPFPVRNEMAAMDVLVKVLLDGIDSLDEPGARPVGRGRGKEMARWEVINRLLKPIVDDTWATDGELDEMAETGAEYRALVAETVCRQMGVCPESMPEFTEVDLGGES